MDILAAVAESASSASHENINIYWAFGMLIMALAALVFGAQKFTGAAESVGHSFGLPQFVIGVTILAMGTSLPELVASIFAVIGDNPAPTIVAGSVVGSNVTNTFLVLGIAFLCNTKNRLQIDLMDEDIPFLFGTTLLFGFMIYNNHYSWTDGLLSICIAGLYLANTVMRGRAEDVVDVHVMGAYESHHPGATKQEQPHKDKVELRPVVESQPIEEKPAEDHGHGHGAPAPVTWKTYAWMVFAAFLIYVGGDHTVEAVQEVANYYKLDKAIVAGTVVAFASSFPELLISVGMARAGKIEMVLGNVIGASIFNTMAVMGITSLFAKKGLLEVAPQTISQGLPLMLAGVAIFTFITIDRRPSKVEGALLVIFYVYYLGSLIGWL
ncbi:MAG TPA: sodium:calcium antiporter [Candidatus Methylacidiphilales bacterium]|nr:sodium:calcium antiporter [Candidatus Methylacidiphilales bacterium]